MKYYLVQYDGNYADEFDVYFHMIMSETQLKKAKDFVSKTNWGDYDEGGEFYFGTNESIFVSTEELLEQLEEATELTQEQLKVISELKLDHISFGDGLNWDSIIDFDE